MTKFLFLSLVLHAIAAAFVVVGVPALRLTQRDPITVSVLLDAPKGEINSVTQKRARLPAPSTPPALPAPAEPKLAATSPAEHFHADADDPNAVVESPEAHPPAPEVVEQNTATLAHGWMDQNTEYVKSVLEIVTRAKRYPKISRDREEEGLVLLAVALTSDGSVNDVRVEQTCPFERLNRAAVETVRGIAKFPPPPGLNSAGVVTLHIPIRYKITR